MAAALFDSDRLSSEDQSGIRGEDSQAPRISKAVRARAIALKETVIEFVHSDDFDDPVAAERWLGEMPAGNLENPTAPPNNTPPYLAELYAFPLLSREQEQHLFRQMHLLKYQAERLRRDLELRSPPVETVERIERHLEDAIQIRDEIVRCNLRLVVSIAKTIVDSANSLDELISDGNLPLIRAAEIFDFNRGTRFSTYATWAIRHSLYRAAKRRRRIQSQTRSEGKIALLNATDPRNSVTADEIREQDMRATIKQSLDILEPRDRKIVVARFGLDGTNTPKRFREIAESLNLSTERVRQLLARSLEQLRSAIKA